MEDKVRKKKNIHYLLVKWTPFLFFSLIFFSFILVLYHSNFFFLLLPPIRNRDQLWLPRDVLKTCPLSVNHFYTDDFFFLLKLFFLSFYYFFIFTKHAKFISIWIDGLDRNCNILSFLSFVWSASFVDMFLTNLYNVDPIFPSVMSLRIEFETLATKNFLFHVLISP